jgi:hypothetical protein
MSKIDLNSLAETLAERVIDGIDMETAMSILYDMQLEHFENMSESELLEEADWLGVDTDEFLVE